MSEYKAGLMLGDLVEAPTMVTAVAVGAVEALFS
jgi:hypothetical protein